MKKFAAAVLLLAAAGCKTTSEEFDSAVKNQCQVKVIEGCKFVVCGFRTDLDLIAPYGQCQEGAR